MPFVFGQSPLQPNKLRSYCLEGRKLTYPDFFFPSSHLFFSFSSCVTTTLDVCAADDNGTTSFYLTPKCFFFFFFFFNLPPSLNSDLSRALIPLYQEHKTDRHLGRRKLILRHTTSQYLVSLFLHALSSNYITSICLACLGLTVICVIPTEILEQEKL